MDVIELKKIANEVRKGIVTSVHSAKAGHRAVPYRQQMYLRICILRREY